MQGLLHGAPVQRRACVAGAAQATLAVGEQQLRIAMRLPESAQHAKGDLRQGHKPVTVAFGKIGVRVKLS